MRGFKIISLSMIFVLLFGASLLAEIDFTNISNEGNFLQTELSDITTSGFSKSENSISSYKGSHLWTTPYDVKVSGDFAFYPKIYGLEVIDLTDPTERPIAARLLLDYECETIEIFGSYAYIGTRFNGFHIVDISNPEAPFWISHFAMEGWNKDITVNGTVAYVSQTYTSPEPDGVYLIDIANPSAPYSISKFNTAGTPKRTAVLGNHLYIAEINFGLEIVDISNPALPSLIGSFDGNGNPEKTDYTDILLYGDYAFVTDYYSNPDTDLGGFTVLNISDPTNPHLQYTHDLVRAEHLCLDGTTLYISTTLTGLFSFDVTVPSNPALLDQCMDQLFVAELAVYDNYLISTSRLNPYFDISDPTNISLLSNGTLMFPVYGVTVMDNLAYIAQHSSGLTILNISNPELPVLVGNMPTSGISYKVEVIGQTAYVSNRAGLDIIDVSDPANPSLIGAFLDADSTSCEEFTIVGNLLYLAAYPYEAIILDISNPAAPSLISSYSPDNAIPHQGVESYVPYGDYAFLCNTSSGEVEILDISDPTAPVKVGSSSGYYYPMHTTILDHYALISSNPQTGTFILDISDPVNPVLVNHIDAGCQYEWGQAGDYLFMSRYSDGVDIYNFSDVANPYHIGTFQTPGFTRTVKSDGENVYVADDSGFLIMSLNLPTYRAGDTNNDASVNVGDAVFMINFVFNGGAAPEPIEAGDVNCDDAANVGDAVYLINFVFNNGPEPCFPQ